MIQKSRKALGIGEGIRRRYPDVYVVRTVKWKCNSLYF
jgi:hypothetical protein